MSERLRNIVVGITAMLGFAGVAVMMLLFGYAPAWLEGGYDVRLDMGQSGGLSKGGRVQMSGKDIGRIESVELRPPPDWGVVVAMVIEEHIRIPREIDISVSSPIFGGSPALTLTPRRGAAADSIEYLAVDGTARMHVTGEAASLAGQFATELRSALMSGINELKGDMERAQDNFEALSTIWVAVGKNLNELIKTRSPQDVDADATGRTLGNLSTVLARADERLRQIEEVIGGMKRWVADDELRDRVHRLVKNADDLAVKMNDGVDRIVLAADDAGKNLQRLSDSYVNVADELSVAIGALRDVIDKARNGDGTVGRLLNDPALFNNVNDAVERLSLTLDELRRLVEKVQKEGIPVNY